MRTSSLAQSMYSAVCLLVLVFCAVGPHTAQAAPTITLTSPTGGGTYAEGSTMTITWDSTNVDTVSLLYHSCTACNAWIATGVPNTGSYTWKVTGGHNLVAGDTRTVSVEVVGYQTGVGSATSKSDSFTVVVGPEGVDKTTATTESSGDYKVTVTSPNGGEVWEPGKSYTVTWSQENIDSAVVSLMRYDSNLRSATQAATGNVSVSSTAPTGSYTIKVPSDAIEANTYVVKVTGYKTGVGNVSDESNGRFYVKAPGTTLPDVSNPASGMATPRTKWATDVTDTTAVLTGSVNPNNNTEAYAWFDITPERGAKDVADTELVLLPAKNAIIEQKVTAKGLEPDTNYTYRMVVQIRGFRVLGEVGSFTTKAATTQADTPEASTVETSSASAETTSTPVDAGWLHRLTPGSTTQLPAGYGAPYFRYGSVDAMLLRTRAASDTVILTAGAGSTFQKIHKTGRIWSNGAWRTFTWSGVTAVDADGYYQKRVYYLLRPGDPLYSAEGKYAAYIDMDLPGCTSSECTVHGWRLQEYSL